MSNCQYIFVRSQAEKERKKELTQRRKESRVQRRNSPGRRTRERTNHAKSSIDHCPASFASLRLCVMNFSCPLIRSAAEVLAPFSLFAPVQNCRLKSVASKSAQRCR